MDCVSLKGWLYKVIFQNGSQLLQSEQFGWLVLTNGKTPMRRRLLTLFLTLSLRPVVSYRSIQQGCVQGEQNSGFFFSFLNQRPRFILLSFKERQYVTVFTVIIYYCNVFLLLLFYQVSPMPSTLWWTKAACQAVAFRYVEKIPDKVVKNTPRIVEY